MTMRAPVSIYEYENDVLLVQERHELPYSLGVPDIRYCKGFGAAAL